MPVKNKSNFGEQFAVRDNTRTPFVRDRGFITDVQHENHPGETDITDNPMGWMPVVGDVLQAGQVGIDLGNKRYGKALLGAAGLLVPNVLEKPVRQVLKSGATRLLRNAPSGEIGLIDALMRPYKGTNFVMHGVDHGDVIDVLRGETRAMSPSLAVSRMGDANTIPHHVGFWHDHHFIGDKSWLDNSILFNGDAGTPSVWEITANGGSVPSSERQWVADEIWKRAEGLNRGMRIKPEELKHLDTPRVGYFEGKYHGLLPLESARHALFPEPGAIGTVLDPKRQEAVIREFEKLGLPITTYSSHDDKVGKLYQLLEQHPEWRFKSGGLLDRLNKHYNGDRSKIIQAMQYARGGFKRDAATDAGDQYYDIVRQRRNSVFNALLRTGMNPDDAARLAPIIVTQQTMEGGWVLNRKDNNYGGMKSAGKTIVFDSEDDFQDAYIKMLDSKWHNGRAVENSWRSARDLDDWARILNREDLGLATKEAWEKYNKGKQGNDFVYLYAPQWENNNKPYREHLKKTEDRTAAYLKMVEADEPYSSLVPRQEQPVAPIAASKKTTSMPGMFQALIPTSVQKLLNSKDVGGLLLKDYASGGNIHIAPSKKGTFTAAAKKHGKSVQAFASQVLANKENYSPAMVKKANFARNAAKWHGDGGLIERYGIDKVRAAMQKVKR